MPNWKKLIVSGSDAYLSSLTSPSITGSLHGNADTATLATTASYALNIGEVNGFSHTQSVADSTWTINHNLGTQTPLVQVYNESYNQLLPYSITNSTSNTTTVEFTYSQSGYAVVSSGDGYSRNTIQSASYALTASYVESAKSYSETITSADISWNITHSLDLEFPLVQVYDKGKMIMPDEVEIINSNEVLVTFTVATTGSIRIG